jgi:hypothetical protein
MQVARRKQVPELVGSYDLPANDRCLAVWLQLREILADALGVKAEEVTSKSRLIADLGAD